MSEKVPVHFDGSIFHRQPHGGISRVFLNLFRELACIDDLELNLHLWTDHQPADLPAEIKVHRIEVAPPSTTDRVLSRFGIRKIQSDGNRYFGKLSDGIFHSTYYSTFETPGLAQVFTLHDLIFEDFPECFPDDQHRAKHIGEKTDCIAAADVIVSDSLATQQRLSLIHI